MSKTLNEALEIYSQLDKVSDLEKRAQTIYQALDGLTGEENIAVIASQENEYLRGRFSINSLGTKMSQAGYNKLVRQLPLVDGENAFQEDKRDGSKALKHYFFKYCGLNAQEWDERNASNRVYTRLQQNIEVDASEQIQKAYRLLQSENPWEIGAGLIAVSGRRPHEIVARAKFSPIDGEVYRVQFEGQGKKRGENPVFPISLLVPVDVFLKAFRHFRADPDVKAVIKQAKVEAPDDIAKQNRVVDKLSNKRLNRIVKAEFKEVLPPRSETEAKLEEEEADINNTALKSAYLAIATKRDCDGSPARQMLFASKLAGHFIDVDPNDPERMKRIDRDLQHLVTTLGYMSYHIKGDVPLFEPPKPEKIPYNKLSQVRLTPSDREQLDEWCKLWELPQAEAMRKVFELARQALATPTLEPIETQKETEAVDNTAFSQLEEKLESYQQQTEQKFQMLLELLRKQPEATQPHQPVEQTTEQPKTEVVEPQQPKQPSRDWESVPKAELFGEGDNRPAKGTGATEERLRRAIEAVMSWNDQFPADSHQERKWSINIRAIRDLTGANNDSVRQFIEAHPHWVGDHNHKHGIADQYHNRVHKAAGKTSKDLILQEVYPLIN